MQPYNGPNNMLKGENPGAVVDDDHRAWYREMFAPSVTAGLLEPSDLADLLARLLDGGHSTIAGRLAGAFRNSGRSALADEIERTMSAAGYTVRETDRLGM